MQRVYLHVKNTRILTLKHCNLDKLESAMLTVVIDEYLIRKFQKASKERTANTGMCFYTIEAVAISLSL